MVLKVRAGVPLVWRSPTALQFGVDEPLVLLQDVDEATERLLSALISGISRSGYDMMARSQGLPVPAAAELLERLRPVLAPALDTGLDTPLDTAGAPAPIDRIAVEGHGPLAVELRRVLDAEGRLAGPEASTPDIAVLVADWVIAPEDHGSWLRRDIPHLPVVVGDGGVTIGPLVEPGDGPCLYCVQLARTDDDPAWPAIATQLWNRPAPAMTPLAVAEVAAFAARRVNQRIANRPGLPMSWRITADGDISSRAWRRHVDCRCATPAESDWAPAAALASPPSTRRAKASAAPA